MKTPHDGGVGEFQIVEGCGELFYSNIAVSG
jgi:hypothetical protein